MISHLAYQALEAGLDDWVPFAAVVGLAQRLGAQDEPEAIEDGITTIRELVSHGLAVVGEVSDGGFFESSESLDATLARVERASGPSIGATGVSSAGWRTHHWAMRKYARPVPDQ